MKKILKELISSLEASEVKPENKEKLEKLIAILKTKMTNVHTDDNWAAEKVIMITCMLREIMQDKNAKFKLFATSLNPTHLSLDNWVKELFFEDKKSPEPKNKAKGRR